MNTRSDRELDLKVSSDRESDDSLNLDDDYDGNNLTFGQPGIANPQIKKSKLLCKTFAGPSEFQSIFISSEINRSRPDFCEFDPGEDEISWWKVQALDGNNNKKYEGELLITRYKLVFKPYEKCDQNDISNDYS